MKHDQTQYQQKQIEVIHDLEEAVRSSKIDFSTVSAVDDYKNDLRMCLTSVHFPKKELIDQITGQIITSLKIEFPENYYYSDDSLHITITGVQKVSDPKTYNEEDIEKVKNLFDQILPKYKPFKVFFYKLVMFPTNLSLFGTSEETRDEMFLELNEGLKEIGIPNNNVFLNKKYFFCNMTMCRFNDDPSVAFKERVEKINSSLNIAPYLVDSVSLIESNASLGICKNIKTWELKS